ncbi:cyclic nucleotide-binding domain-containing protein 2-like [Plakobranchus ocellatus]|uniref:Cyclic nucleotide-binding domain-containing protein 2-like n=1 Tax=Plakobranchus ocellatus TaxID=259542 RepID=A0AAV3YG18_9GAST|nr:cyclic nucleotide-binding domain-containing protein 2-like [Plakobranchus ocellatus]
MAALNFRHELMAIPEDDPVVFELPREKAKTMVYSVSPRMAAIPKLPPIGGNHSHVIGNLLSPVRENEQSVFEDAEIEDPIVKFRRMARVVLLLIQVCNVCKDIVTAGVKKEPWYALLDNLVATSNIKQKRKGPRPFVTFVPNEKRELVQLTFDLNEFKKEHKSEYILTDEVREILSVLPKQRPPESIPKIIRCMKGLFEEFNNYSLSVQKQICQSAFYDKYRYNRVIVKKGHDPDGIYFVLSGSLIEKHDIGKQPREIHTGSMFGENDLVCGSRRRHTVLTRTDTELLYLHRQDYRVIFNMADDSNDPKNLDICRQHSVFQHFPMARLVDNPGTWSVIKYKYGRLIAKDNNELDWIYVIKSGEARVFKYLHPGNIDVHARRKKVQAMKNAQNVFHIKKKILNFVEDREYIKSSYSPRRYQPGLRSVMSAPAGASRDHALMQATGCRREVFTCIPGMRPTHSRQSQGLGDGAGAAGRKSMSQMSIIDSTSGGMKRMSITSRTSAEKYNSQHTHRQSSVDSRRASATVRLPKLKLEHVKDDENAAQSNGNALENGNTNSNVTDEKTPQEEVVTETIKDLNDKDSAQAQTPRTGRTGSLVADAGHTPHRRASTLPNQQGNTNQNEAGATGQRTRSGSFIKTPYPSPTRSQASAGKSQQPTQVIQVGNHTLPAFVQVETLNPGQVFGLRSCLDPEERGPSVSLVSGDCEVLQINKKFFMKHCDEAIYSLIRLKAKKFPSQEDLIDRLDVNMQWEEYKQQTMGDFLQRCRRLER